MYIYIYTCEVLAQVRIQYKTNSEYNMNRRRFTIPL